ncbi:prefoldin subunit alpha [Candidatus Micrarchaeota archaeon CG08_land_8_20_14_0_20_59_11]|nr:MAG: prefoldin subunit alpha [Candidatus Micrarchaeota archaeon CG08_land_8_20_14_0_20_59_11]
MSEDEMRKLAYEMSFYRSQAAEIERQNAMVRQLIEENNATTKALESLPEITKDAMFSIGSGVFIKGRATDEKRVLVEIGSRIIAEKTAEAAKALLAEKRKELTKAAEELSASFAAVGKRMEELEARASALQK